MTICASYFTFRNFGLDGIPRSALSNHVTKLLFLLSFNMVKLQNYDFCFPTVDAWMCFQIFDNSFTGGFSCPRRISPGLFYVVITITLIM